MSIFDTIKEGLRIARSSKSLWLFGFFVGLGSSGGGSGGGSQAGVPQPGAVAADGSLLPLIALVVVVTVAAGLAMRVLSEGALIEGVRRARRHDLFTVRAGIREGLAHWATILFVYVLYILASLLGIAVLAAPSMIAAPLIGVIPSVVLLGIPAAVIGVPWLVTLYIWQAFTTRIAVLENRRGIDAIRKARLFLHGRIWLGLKLIVATLLGTVFATLAAVLLIGPFVLLAAGISEVGAGSLAIVLSLPVLVPAVAIAIAIVGTFRSSVWTIGYLTEVEASP